MDTVAIMKMICSFSFFKKNCKGPTNIFVAIHTSNVRPASNLLLPFFDKMHNLCSTLL